jgi:hypothetical protein
MRRAAKVDSNQSEIVAALRKVGAAVVITSQLKNAFDLLVMYRSRIYIVEVKDGSLTPSARKLTDGEMKCKKLVESVGVKYHIITSVDEALKMVKCLTDDSVL